MRITEEIGVVGQQLRALWYDDYWEFIEHTTDDARIFREGQWKDYSEAQRSEPRTHPAYMVRVANNEDHAWAAGMTWRETKKILLCDGWVEGADRMRAIAEGIEGEMGNQMEAKQVCHDVCGQALDVAAYLSGQPECFMDLQQVQRAGAGRVVSIVLNNTSCKDTKSVTYLNRGAALLSLIDILETAGYRCDLTVFCSFCNDNYSHEFVVMIPIKAGNEPANVERIAFALGHPAFTRRAVYNIMDGQPLKYRRTIGRGTKGLSRVGLCYPKAAETEGGIHILNPIKKDDFLSFSACKSWITYVLQNQGITILEAAPVPG